MNTKVGHIPKPRYNTHCEVCGVKLVQRKHEDKPTFAYRRFCNRDCYNEAFRKPVRRKARSAA